MFIFYIEVVGDTSPRLLRRKSCVHVCRRGTADPQPLRISWSLAMAEFSVKSFALFMWWRVYEACSQICSLTDKIFIVCNHNSVDCKNHQMTTHLMHFYLICDMMGDESSFVYSCSIMLSESWWLDFSHLHDSRVFLFSFCKDKNRMLHSYKLACDVADSRERLITQFGWFTVTLKTCQKTIVVTHAKKNTLDSLWIVVWRWGTADHRL